LQSSDETLDFWSEPFRVGQPVDIHVNSDNYDALAHLLNSAGIQNHIKVEDLGRAIEEERVSIEFRRELTKNQKAFDFENYHTYEEVKKIFCFTIKGSHQNCYHRLLVIWKAWHQIIQLFPSPLSARLTRIVV
jgi:hypothetical protein